MSVAVVRFPGSLDHESALRAVRGVRRADAQAAWHADESLLAEGTTAVVLPGRLQLRRPPAPRRHRQPGADHGRDSRARRFGGGRVLGICNGFQVLCEAGMLPGGAGRQ